MDNKAYEYYKSITSKEYVELFAGIPTISGQTLNELYYGGSFNKIDRNYYDEAINNELYVVHGRIYDEKINSIIRTEYSFKELKDAEIYFELLISVYPISQVSINRKSWQQLRCYS